MAEPSPKVEMDPAYEAQMKSLRAQAAVAGAAAVSGGQAKWTMPEKDPAGKGAWEGDLDDLEGIGKAFTRAQANEQAVKSLADPENPGMVGDVVVAATMVDYLACMERAFRARHASRLRREAHAVGRTKGHGDPRGPLGQALEGVRGLLKAVRS